MAARSGGATGLPAARWRLPARQDYAPSTRPPFVSPEDSNRSRRSTLSILQFGRMERVGQQHRNRHRPDAAGHRRNPACALAHRGEIDVADQLSVRVPIDADVDDDCALLDPIALHEVRTADG